MRRFKSILAGWVLPASLLLLSWGPGVGSAIAATGDRGKPLVDHVDSNPAVHSPAKLKLEIGDASGDLADVDGKVRDETLEPGQREEALPLEAPADGLARKDVAASVAPIRSDGIPGDLKAPASKGAAPVAIAAAADDQGRFDFDGWRPLVLAIMTVGSLNLSRTTVIGRKFFAPEDLTNQDVQRIADKNFRRASEWVVDNAAALPLSRATEIEINRILTQDLVPESHLGDSYYHGDSDHHRHVRLFYDWLDTPRASAEAKADPVAFAEKLHYAIPFLDHFPDGNGRTSRLMADLALLKGGFAPAFYTNIEDYFARGSMRAGVKRRERQAFFREMVERGQKAVKDPTIYIDELRTGPKLSDAIVQHIAKTEGNGGVDVKPEDRDALATIEMLRGNGMVSSWTYQRIRAELVFKLLREKIRELPAPLKRFVLGISLLEVVGMGMVATMAVYGIGQFGLFWAVVATSVSLLTRIPGSLVAARLKNFEADRIYRAAVIFQGLQILILPIGFYLFGGHSAGYLAVFIASQAIYGLVYGSTSGMAESAIMPMLVGRDRAKLEQAKSFLFAGKLIFGLVSAFLIGPIMSVTLGIQHSILLYAIAVFATLPLFFKLKGEAPAAETEAEAAARREDGVDRLPRSEYLPWIAAVLCSYAFFTVFLGNVAVYLVNLPGMAGMATEHSHLISLFSLGAWSLGGAVISSTKAFNETSALDRLSLKGWFGAMVISAGLYFATALAGLQWLNLTAAVLFGATVNFNRSQWMAYYQSRLREGKHKEMISVINSVTMGLAFALYLALAASQVFSLPIVSVLQVIAAGMLLSLLAVWAATPKR